jgi:hypothetical protein
MVEDASLNISMTYWFSEKSNQTWFPNYRNVFQRRNFLSLLAAQRNSTAQTLKRKALFF